MRRRFLMDSGGDGVFFAGLGCGDKGVTGVSEDTAVYAVFGYCVRAIQRGQLIRRDSLRDKEFHFQDWVAGRLDETGLYYEVGGRNSYPDFRMVGITEGYEVKGLAYPGREANYDCNSQVPNGKHNGRTIYYVFGRYPSKPDGDSYPVLDLVICHGDYINADHEYVHCNQSMRGFGSYGDILIRDRKMYVAPTPFGLASGVAHMQTLILPSDYPVADGFQQVGELVRAEAQRLVVRYAFDLRSNTLMPDTIANPSAGREHVFRALRLEGMGCEPVVMRDVVEVVGESGEDDDGE